MATQRYRISLLLFNLISQEWVHSELCLKLQSSNHKHPLMAYQQQQGILLLYKKKTTDDIMIPSVLKKTHAHQ